MTRGGIITDSENIEVEKTCGGGGGAGSYGGVADFEPGEL